MFRLEKQADIVVDYSADRRIDIGIGEVDRRGIRNIVDHDPSDLISFFDQQRHKDLVVVVFAKRLRSHEDLSGEIAHVKRYFEDRGYRRISIQQAGAQGRGEHLDYRPQFSPTRECRICLENCRYWIIDTVRGPTEYSFTPPMNSAEQGVESNR